MDLEDNIPSRRIHSVELKIRKRGNRGGLPSSSAAPLRYLRRLPFAVALGLVCCLIALLPLVPEYSRPPSTLGHASGEKAQARNDVSSALPAEYSRQPTAAPSQLPPAPIPVEPDLLRASLEHPTQTLHFIVYLDEPSLPAESGGKNSPTSAQEQLALRQSVITQLQDQATRSQAGLLSFLAQEQRKGSVQKVTSLWIANAVAVAGQASLVPSIATRPEVRLVRADHHHQLENHWQGPSTSQKEPANNTIGASFSETDVEWNISRIRADQVWRTLGITGTGVVVASMDTGVDWQHPALLHRYRGFRDKGLAVHAGNWKDFTVQGYLYPGDGNGHGTHTTGTMVGEGGIGVAPGAQWIAAKAFDSQGNTYDSWLHAAFQWLLAPEGNPSLAPDIVNASWSSEVTGDATFRPDIQALRAAQIMPVFAAGNYGPAEGSIGSPASLPEALAVAALDSQEDVATFSGRGPSPFGFQKPEIAAPGVKVRSALTGGRYGTGNGTSMAAPHIAGTAALLRSANPLISIGEIEHVLTTTTVPLGSSLPNNATGWGRVDALQAVVRVIGATSLEGQIYQAGTRQPLSFAQVHVISPYNPQTQSEKSFEVAANPDGSYIVYLLPGTYQVVVTAFGFQPATAVEIRLRSGDHLHQDFAVSRTPGGILAGKIRDAATTLPLSATLTVLDTPLVITTTVSSNTNDQSPENGSYQIPLPAGNYTVEVTTPAHRIIQQQISVLLNQTSIADFALPAAPHLLLVDTGAWYYGSQASYFLNALHTLRYPVDTLAMKHLDQIPRPADLLPYDIVLWSAPQDSPGIIGAAETISTYLKSGGRLLLTGQDIAFWDGGGSNVYFYPYLRDLLYTAFRVDATPSREVKGLPTTPFSDVLATINGIDSANDQTAPDVIAPTNPEHAIPMLVYTGPTPDDPDLGNKNPQLTNAGLQVDQCLPYKAHVWGFGLEGISDKSTQATILGRALDDLQSTAPQFDFRLAPIPKKSVPQEEPETLIALPGETITLTLRLRNIGTSTDQYQLSISSDWPASLYDKDFHQPLDSNITLASCSQQDIGIQIRIPPDAAADISRTLMLGIISHGQPGPTHNQQYQVTVKTPAPVLVVDDDRFIDVQDAYYRTLTDLGIHYDKWQIGWNPGQAQGSPSLTNLAKHKTIIWFTGYDWNNTLSTEEERSLAKFLNNGGRLFFSSQDYLYTNRLNDFGQTYLGVVTYTEGLSSTAISGIPGNQISQRMGPFPLNLPYRNWSDTLVAEAGAIPIFTGQLGQVNSIANDQPTGGASVFFAFPFEGLDEQAGQKVMYNVLGWLQDLGESTWEASTDVAGTGEHVRYKVTLRNRSTKDLTGVRVQTTLPDSLQFITGTATVGWHWDAESRVLRWEGTVPAQQQVILPYESEVMPAEYTQPASSGSRLAQSLVIDDRQGMPISRTVNLRLNAPDLRSSSMRAAPTIARSGDVLTYTLVLRNQGRQDTLAARLVIPVPGETQLITSSVNIVAGLVSIGPGQVITWTGPIRVGKEVTLTYQTVISSQVQGITLQAQAQLDDRVGEVTSLTSITEVLKRIFLPLVKR
ncbi:MAG: DUF11 domain-containing protein [Chloroflexi bacterium]|nr:DUF11 domain-containing protein [Chloroflexota bacterium]